MPFDEDEPIEDKPKKGLKSVSSQKSMFDSIPKKPTQQDFERKVAANEEKASNYKRQASELALQFKKMLEDKTLPQNKSVFATEVEKETLVKMVQLAVEMNNDPNEQEGMGSMAWITLLLKILLSQRDKINLLEYNLSLLSKKIEPSNLSAQIVKELKLLDKDKSNE